MTYKNLLTKLQGPKNQLLSCKIETGPLLITLVVVNTFRVNIQITLEALNEGKKWKAFTELIDDPKINAKYSTKRVQP